MPISDKSLTLNKQLHESSSEYGGRKLQPIYQYVPTLLDKLISNGICRSYLDYGAGKGQLYDICFERFSSQIQIDGYDPCVDRFSSTPPLSSYDIVTCFDVLEHVEFDEINLVLADIALKTSKAAILIVDLLPAKKKLADGRNAHVLIAPPSWWCSTVSAHFSVFQTVRIDDISGYPSKIAFACSNDPAGSLFLAKAIVDLQLNTVRTKYHAPQ